MSETLYRFYSSDDQLLYVGITNSLPRRIKEHRKSKLWFEEAVKITLEHFDSREAVMRAEVTAIRSEKPRYNVQHATDGPAVKTSSELWSYRSRRTDYEHVSSLWLYPEIDCSPVVDDYWDLDGDGQLYAWVDYIRKSYPKEWEADAVPIYWSISGKTTSGGYVSETAPFGNKEHVYGPDFLTSFTWPENTATGELVDWFRLPVINSRFPKFAEALGWLPGPFQETCPIRSLITSRSHGYSDQTLARSKTIRH